MTDDLLSYYNDELNAFFRSAEAFAAEHPDVAAELRLGTQRVDDPHVERLIQAFAFLAARVQMRLDDDFPELTDTLLDILYPHYLAPKPSMAIVQFPYSPGADSPIRIGRGTLLDAEPIDDVRCRFRTAYPVTLWPFEINAASLTGAPLQAPSPACLGIAAAASLRLSLNTTAPDLSFARLAKDGEKAAPSTCVLRVYLCSSRSLALALYRLLFAHTLAIAVGTSPSDPRPTWLPRERLREVGFAAEEALLPTPPQGFAAYRLLSEVFAFPEKFLFFDLAIDAEALGRAGRTLDIFIYLSQSLPDLERQIGVDCFALGCTPVVNLFERMAEPIDLDQTRPEYRIEVDDRRGNAFEVYAIDGVRATSSAGRAIELRPFYATRHSDTLTAGGPRWHSQRRPAADGKAGSETVISFVDDDFQPAAQAGWTAMVATTCLNRDHPARLPGGVGRPLLTFVEGAAKDAPPVCLVQPTPTLRPNLRDGAPWRLISHLALNHLSLAGDDSGGEARANGGPDLGAGSAAGGEARGAVALRQLLTLYDARQSPDTRQMIDAIVGISYRQGIARIRSVRPPLLVHGIDIRLDLAADRLAGSGVFLLASVLDHFFALYGSINSFTRLSIGLDGETEPLHTWPARAGERILI